MYRGSGGCEVHPLLADVSVPSPLPPVQAAPATVLTGFGSTSQRERLEQARAAARAAAAAAMAPALAPAPAAALRQQPPEAATRAAASAAGQPPPPPVCEPLPSRVPAEAFDLLHTTPTADRAGETTGVAGGAGDAERAAPPQVAAAPAASAAPTAPAAPAALAAPAPHALDRSIGAHEAAALPSLHLKQARLLESEQAARPVAKALAELSDCSGRSSGRSSGHSSGDRAPMRELRNVGGTLVKKNRAAARRRAGGTLQSKSAQVGAQPASKSFRF